MLNDAEFKEINDFYIYITELNFTIEEITNNGSRNLINYKYIDLCKPLCYINDQFQKLMVKIFNNFNYW